MYVNLHHHDEYSMRDALGTCDQYAKLLKAREEKYMSITNHGSIGGWIKQRAVCDANGLKPIFGMEAYYSNYRGDDMEIKKQNRSANHLILIAKTLEGYSNIIRIHNDAQLHGFYYTPRVNDEALQKWGKGIIATSACYAGEIPKLLEANDVVKAKARYEFLKSCFDKFYIEIQLIEMEEQKELNRKLIAFAKEVGAPIILGIDSHYLYAENSETHDIMMCIRQRRTIQETSDADDDTWLFSVKNLYCRSYEQVKDLYENGFQGKNGIVVFKDDVFNQEVFDEACSNTVKVSEEVENIKVDTSIKLPKLYADSEAEFKKLVMEGFNSLGLDKKPNAEEYKARIKHEIDVITLAGWSDYFLIVKMIVDEARRLKGEWATGIGRGSAAGSLVSYVLRITLLDPIEYGLDFARFLDYSRTKTTVCEFKIGGLNGEETLRNI
jgi:DNA polymerase-3 subunit alpha